MQYFRKNNNTLCFPEAADINQCILSTILHPSLSLRSPFLDQRSSIEFIPKSPSTEGEPAKTLEYIIIKIQGTLEANLVAQEPSVRRYPF